MSRYRDDSSEECKVYVGDLPRDVSEKELERVFREFGSVRSVWVARNPPGFAFVMFDDERDAEDAVKNLDGRSALFVVGKNNLLSLHRNAMCLRIYVAPFIPLLSMSN